MEFFGIPLLTLCCQCAASDAVCDLAETRVHVQHFGRRGLCLVLESEHRQEIPVRAFEYLQHLKKGVMRTKPML